jgi:hypothetical protein
VGLLLIASLLMLRDPLYLVFMITAFFHALHLRPVPLALFGLAQGFTGIITQLEAAEQAGEDTAERRRHMATASALARETSRRHGVPSAPCSLNSWTRRS